MKLIAPVRKMLKVQTFFNILGTMTNPSFPKYQVLGVNNEENFNHYKNVYETLNVNYTVINSKDGYDEVSLTAPTRLPEMSRRAISRQRTLDSAQSNPKVFTEETQWKKQPEFLWIS